MARWPHHRYRHINYSLRKRRRGLYERIEEENDQQKVFSIRGDPLSFFTDATTTQQHYEAQNEDCGHYCSAFAVLIKSGFRIDQDTKIRALAVALGRNDKQLVSACLQTRSQFGPVEVSKAITLLDAGRQIRVHLSRYKSLELSKIPVRSNKLLKLQTEINKLNKTKIPVGTVSGAVCKHIRRWVRGFTSKELKFYAVHSPKEPWKKLANICHFKPNDFPAARWFLPYCFSVGEFPWPYDIKAWLQATDTDQEIPHVSDQECPFSVVMKFLSSETFKERIAINVQKLDTVLLNYVALACPKVNEVIYQRLCSGEPVILSNGKLLDIFFNIAEYLRINENPDSSDNFFTRLSKVVTQRLTTIRPSIECPIAILALSGCTKFIYLGAVITSLLRSLCYSANGKLVNSHNPPAPPTVTEIWQSALEMKESRYSSEIPSALLLPFYERKEVVKTFFIVTDHIYDDRFGPLFQRYRDEVYPSSLVFIQLSFYNLTIYPLKEEIERRGFAPTVLILENSGKSGHIKKFVEFFVESLCCPGSFRDQLAAAEEETRAEGVVKLFEGIQGADQVYLDEDN